MASGIKYTSEVLNQRGAPALFEDILANRPAAGFVGRLFFATDITSGNTIFRDNGATWDVLAGNGGGGGGGVTTLSNGLTLTGSNGTLGGTLLNDTTISSSTFLLKVLSTNAVGTTAIFGSTSSSNDGGVHLGNFEIYGTIQSKQTSTLNNTLLYLQKDGGDLQLGSTTNFNINQTNSDFIFNNGTVLIGTSTDLPSSIFTVASTTKGALLPRMTTTQRNAITSPATGLLVYDTTLLLLYQYNGTAWAAVGGASTNIYNTDGSLTSARTLTLNSQPLTIAGTTSSRFFANGNVGIGTTTDAGYKLDVNGTTRIQLPGANERFTFVANGGYQGAILYSNHLVISSATTLAIGAGTGSRIALGCNSNDGLSDVAIGYPNTLSSSSTAILDIRSSTKGVVLPRMTTTQINAIASPAEGLLAYNTTISHLCCYQAGAWVKFNHSPM